MPAICCTLPPTANATMFRMCPLLSTIIVEKTVQDLLNLMHDLSAYSDQFLNMVCVKLQEYKDTCTAAYRGIVQSEEKLVISASWAKDDDISRLLKSLPNWINMAQPKQLRPKREDEEDFISFLGSSVSMLAYDGDSDSSHGTQGTHSKHSSLLGRVRAAFGKESEVLIGNLGDKLIPPQDILRDVSDLKALANMHESLEWLAGRTKSAFSNLSTSQRERFPNGNIREHQQPQDYLIPNERSIFAQSPREDLD
ncbi:Exocyst complex component 4 [Myotis brandtii]|uniref:Exocyst complex component Sec8 n=1 Tax=Myotis brandtii TaxID=109478 RepID=S7NSU0_MYOBR|nr:Exocyst complex component 4 [Myotis brandtii]